MVTYRPFTVLFAGLAGCTSLGCVAFHTTSPVEMVLTHAESAWPAANKMVILTYEHEIFQGAPGSLVKSTDENGRVVCPIANVDFPMTLQAGRAVFCLDREIVRTGGILKYFDEEENLLLHVTPREPTLLERLFGFGWYGTVGAL